MWIESHRCGPCCLSILESNKLGIWGRIHRSDGFGDTCKGVHWILRGQFHCSPWGIYLWASCIIRINQIHTSALRFYSLCEWEGSDQGQLMGKHRILLLTLVFLLGAILGIWKKIWERLKSCAIYQGKVWKWRFMMMVKLLLLHPSSFLNAEPI